MADHSKPLITSTYANFVTELDGRFDDLTLGLDPATTTPTNVPTGAIRWNSASYKWEKWSGSAWADLSPYYNINLSGPLTLTANSASDALRITQTGAGNALLVEDAANPDSSPFVITGAGDVGVGTSSPGFKLQVIGTSQLSLSGAGTQQALQLNNNDTTAGTQAVKLAFSSSSVTKSSINAAVYGNDYMTFNVGSDTERMRIDSSGNLGIGTSSPSGYGKLVVAGNSGSGAIVSNVMSGGNAGDYAIVQVSTSTTTKGRLVADASTGDFRLDTGASSGAMTFHTGASYAERMRIDSSGNLGLGVTPTTGGYGRGFQFSNDSTSELMSLWTQAVNTNDHRLWLTNNAKSTGVGTWAYFGTGQSATAYQQVGGIHAWFTAPSGTAGTAISFTQAMTLGSTGNLALGGTSTSGSYRLILSGDTGSAVVGGLSLTTNGNTAYIGQVSSASADCEYWNVANGYVRIGTNNLERVRVSADGHVGIGSGSVGNTALRLSNSITGSTNSYGVYTDQTVASDVTSRAAYFWSTPFTQAAAFTCADLIHYGANNMQLGAGSAVTNQYGFYSNLVATTASTATYNFYGSATSATTGKTMYGMRLRVGESTGTNYNLYIDGAAPNYLAGITSIGTTGSSAQLTVNNALDGGTGIYVTTTGSSYLYSGSTPLGYIYGGTTGGLGGAILNSTDGTSSGMILSLYKDSPSPANGDSIALIRNYGNDSTSVQTEYSRYSTVATTVTNGSEQGAVDIRIMNAGTLSTVLVLNSTSDFRAIGAYNSTTASAANVVVGSSGQLSRSTSSGQYKTDVENLEPMRSESIYQMRPVWYRSLCENDNKSWSWYGFIAEEMAEIEPRLVHWGYAADQYDEVLVGECDQAVTEKVLKEDAVLQPEGVQYDRITVFLVEEMQKMKAEMDALKAEVAALKSK